jgi:TatD DNase family protein
MDTTARVSNWGLADTHAHICDPVFDADRTEVLDRAARTGIHGIVCVGENLSDARKNIDLARIYPILKPAAGLYPTRLDMVECEQMLAFIRKHRSRLIAIGEVGLDFWMVKDKKGRLLQQEIFARFISLAIELDLPLNVHSRSAGRYAVDLLVVHGARRVQLHAFDGKIGAAQPAVEAGYGFSVPPSVVRSRQKQKLVKNLPMESLLVETDSPVLAAEPGVRNEPANLSVAIRSIAEIKGLAESEVLRSVIENTRRIYGGR